MEEGRWRLNFRTAELQRCLTVCKTQGPHRKILQFENWDKDYMYDVEYHISPKLSVFSRFAEVDNHSLARFRNSALLQYPAEKLTLSPFLQILKVS